MAATPLASSAITPSIVVTTTPMSDLMARQTNGTTTINVHGNENLMSITNITNETHDDHLYLSMPGKRFSYHWILSACFFFALKSMFTDKYSQKQSLNLTG